MVRDAVVSLIFVAACLASASSAELQSDQHVLVDQLPGRPLLAGNGAGVGLRRAFADTQDPVSRRRPYLVRVENPIKNSLLQSLRAVAGSGMRYAPHDTYIMSMTGEEMKMISEKEGVVGVFHVPMEMKVESALLAAIKRRREAVSEKATWNERLQARSSTGTVTFLIGSSLHVDSDPSHRTAFLETVRADLASCGLVDIKARLASSTKIACEVPADTEGLSKFVQCAADAWWSLWISEKPVYRAWNYYAGRIAQSGGLDAPIWDRGLTGEGEVVGLADSGIDVDGCFFGDATQTVASCSGDGVLPNCVNFDHRKIVTYRAVQAVLDGDTGTEIIHDHDKDGHGTHVAGTIAGRFTDTSNAAALENGVARDAKLAFDDIDDRDAFNGLEVPDDLAEALFPHSYHQAGARIHSNSWGSSFSGYSPSAMDVDAFVFANDDMLVLVAAGNDGDLGPAETVGEPATHKNGLAVGATENAPELHGGDSETRSEDQIVGFSSLGPTKDGRIKPEVYCVGTDVASAASDTSAGCPSSADRPETVQLSGTSMATPACAGAAALTREYLRKGYWPSGSMTAGDAVVSPSAALVKGMLINSATAHALRHPRLPLATTPGRQLGFGRVDLSSVLKFQDSAFELKLVDRQAVDHGRFHAYVINGTGTGPIRVTLCWTDPPSFPSAVRNLVNDLDLVVRGPDGAELRGNDFSGAGQADALNNVEHVTVPATTGQVRVEVYGTDLPWSPRSQLFALVVAGGFVDAGQESSGAIEGFPTVEDGGCSGRVTLTAANGTLTDGSGEEAYVNHLSCEWVIAPPNASVVTVSVVDIDTQADQDWIEAFQCRDALCLQRTFIGAVAGADTAVPDVFSYTGVMLIRFSSDGETTGAGFTLRWSTSFTAPEQCSGQGTLTEATGSFGSAVPYANNLYCVWVIAPTNVTTVTITFSLFDTEENYDFVRVYELEGEGESQIQKLVSTLTGSLDAPTVTVHGAAAQVVFSSDNSVVGGGFSATYTSAFTAPDPSPEPAPTQCNASSVLVAQSGSLADGSGDRQYENELSCEWVIAPPGAEGVQLEFTAFDTEEGFDFVRVFECDTAECGTQTQVYELSGVLEPFNLQVTTPAVKITFTTDGSFTAAGFAVSWSVSSAACSGEQTLTDASGSFEDGSGPGPYADNLDCAWTIEVADATALDLTFTTFDTEEGYDFVRVFECPTAACTEMVAELSGLHPGRKVRATTPSMRVAFESDSSITSGGFAASWTAEFGDATTEDPTCSGVVELSEVSGSFEDGSGAGVYANGMDCIWVIAVPGAASMEVVFSEFETEEPNDYVVVAECFNADCAEFNVIAYLSGSQPGFSVVASTGTVVVVFESDGSVGAGGFAVSWTSSTEAVQRQCGGLQTLTEASGSLADGSGDRQYQNELSCEWVIAPPGAEGVQLEFTAFDTEEGFDFVRVFECDTAECGTQTQVYELSGVLEPFVVQLMAAAVKVEFSSDDSLSGDGFSITWGAISAACSAEQLLTDASGSFTDGEGAVYQNDLSCEWIIAPPDAYGVVLYFSALDTEEGYDFVRVFECDGELCGNRVLAYELTGFYLPPLTLQSSSSAVAVTFTSDVSIGSGGFSATWDVVSTPCSGRQLLTDAAGSLTDGDGAAYANDLTCAWVIAPPDAVAIDIVFSELETEEGFDYVAVYACADPPECRDTSALALLSGVQTGYTVQSTTAVLLNFTTDDRITGRGFTAQWTSVPSAAAATTSSAAASTTPPPDMQPSTTAPAVVETTPAPAAVSLRVVSTLTGVTAAQLRANLGGFRASVASVHSGVSADDVVVDEESIADVEARRRHLLAGAVSVAYEIQGFEDTAAAEAAKAVQESQADALQAELVSAGFTDLQAVHSAVIVRDAQPDDDDDADVLSTTTPATAAGQRVMWTWVVMAVGGGLAVAMGREDGG